jgi:DNA-binding transcriptional LysR family regulator
LNCDIAVIIIRALSGGLGGFAGHIRKKATAAPASLSGRSLVVLHSRAAIYFDEVARHGSIRRAAERLHIAASAIDRQLLQLEQYIGAPLFERNPHGMRLTAAGELLIDAVRRWRRDYDRVRSVVDDLQGARRGRVSIAAVEGAAGLLSISLGRFRQQYPGIGHHLLKSTAQEAVNLVMSGECDFALTFNPPPTQHLRVEQTSTYRLGLVVPPDHPMAGAPSVSLAECADLPLIIPDPTLSLRLVIDQIWERTIGVIPYNCIEVNSIAFMKTLVKRGAGVAMLTSVDALEEVQEGRLVYIELSDERVPLSVLSLVTNSTRLQSVPASLLMNAVIQGMISEQSIVSEVN